MLAKVFLRALQIHLWFGGEHRENGRLRGFTYENVAAFSVRGTLFSLPQKGKVWTGVSDAASGRRRVAARYDWDVIVDRTVAVYDEAVASYAAGGISRARPASRV